MNRLPRIVRRAALASVTVVASVLAATTPAEAVVVTWQAAPCATGAITDYLVSADRDSSWPALAATTDSTPFRAWIRGWVQPCGTITGAPQFAFAMYHTKASYILIRPDKKPSVRPYASLVGPTAFEGSAPIGAVDQSSSEDTYGG